MTREELKKHCLKEIEDCEMWARINGEERYRKIYEEHELILELLEQETVSKESYDHEYFLRKEFELKIAKLRCQLKEQTVKAESILGKIKAEIEQLPTEKCTETCSIRIDADVFKENVLAILDKHRTESEEV